MAGGDHPERTPIGSLVVGDDQEEITGDELAAVSFGDLVGELGDEIQGAREGVVGGELLGFPVEEEKAAPAALHYLPSGEDVVVVLVRDAGEEDVEAADGGRVVPIGAAADGREGGVFVAVGVEEEAEERGRVQRSEAEAEGGGGADGGQEGAAGEGGADERREGREAEEDLAQEVVGEVTYGGGGGRFRR